MNATLVISLRNDKRLNDGLQKIVIFPMGIFSILTHEIAVDRTYVSHHAFNGIHAFNGHWSVSL